MGKCLQLNLRMPEGGHLVVAHTPTDSPHYGRRPGGRFFARDLACIDAPMNARELMGVVMVNVGRDLGVVLESIYCMPTVMALVGRNKRSAVPACETDQSLSKRIPRSSHVSNRTRYQAGRAPRGGAGPMIGSYFLLVPGWFQISPKR